MMTKPCREVQGIAMAMLFQGGVVDRRLASRCHSESVSSLAVGLTILAPIAAACIATEMQLFSGLHMYSGDANYGHMIYWLVVAATCAFIAYGRFMLKPCSRGRRCDTAARQSALGRGRLVHYFQSMLLSN